MPNPNFRVSAQRKAYFREKVSLNLLRPDRRARAQGAEAAAQLRREHARAGGLAGVVGRARRHPRRPDRRRFPPHQERARPQDQREDAAWIVQLVRHRLVASSFVPPPAIRDLRELVRHRHTLTETQTAVRN